VDVLLGHLRNLYLADRSRHNSLKKNNSVIHFAVMNHLATFAAMCKRALKRHNLERIRMFEAQATVELK